MALNPTVKSALDKMNVPQGVQTGLSVLGSAALGGLAARRPAAAEAITRPAREQAQRDFQAEQTRLANQEARALAGMKMFGELAINALRDRNTPEPMRQELSRGLQAINEQLGGVGFEGLPLDQVIQPLQKEDKFTQRGFFRTQDGEELPAVQGNDGITRIQHQGKLVTPSELGVPGRFFTASQLTGSSEDVGLTKSQFGKEVQNFIAAEDNVVKVLTRLNDLRTGLDDPQASVGLTSSLIQFGETVRSQIEQASGNILRNDEGQINEGLLDDPELSENTRSAIKAGEIDSAIIDLAYVFASAREGGKLTDADVRLARETFTSGSKPVMKAKITSAMRRFFNDHNAVGRRRGARFPEQTQQFRPLTEELLGFQISQSGQAQEEGTENPFVDMPKADLINVDINSLSEDDLKLYLEATRSGRP